MNDELLQSDVAEYAQALQHMRDYIENGNLERDFMRELLYGSSNRELAGVCSICEGIPVLDLETE